MSGHAWGEVGGGVCGGRKEGRDGLEDLSTSLLGLGEKAQGRSDLVIE